MDAAIEIYLSLEDRILSIKFEGSNFCDTSVEEQQALRDLNPERSAHIKSADKGLRVVVWDREDYLKETENHLSDCSVYVK